MLTKELLDSLFDYSDGKLYRKTANSRRVKIGDVVGSKSGNGYISTTIDSKKYQVHRLIFLMFNGFLPESVDHINGVVSDNRIENLREATHAENMRNRKVNINNSVGVKGVYFDKTKKKFRAQISLNKRVIFLGYYDNKEDAHKAYCEASKDKHGLFSRTY